MSGSKKVKREFGFLWEIIAVFMSVVGINSIIKSFLSDTALTVSVALAAFALVVLTGLYFFKLKPALNQVILFAVCLAIFLASIVSYIYNLPYKNTLGILSIPTVLVLCGMWIYTRFAQQEVK